MKLKVPFFRLKGESLPLGKACSLCLPPRLGASPLKPQKATKSKCPWLQNVNETWQLVALVELCSMSISSTRSHGFGLRPLMFARRLIFLRLWAFISRCHAGLANSHLQLCCLEYLGIILTEQSSEYYEAKLHRWLCCHNKLVAALKCRATQRIWSSERGCRHLL